MSDYVAARDALERLHHAHVAAVEDREDLLGALRLIRSTLLDGSIGPDDALLSCQTALRQVSQTLDPWEARP